MHQRLNAEIVHLMNQQINLELQASYFYQGAAVFCSQSSVALPGFEKFFHQESEEERKHAQQVIDYLIQRDQKVKLTTIPFRTPEEQTITGYLTTSLELEKEVTDSIYHLSDQASELNDHHLTNWLDDFGAHQIEAIHELKSLLTKLERVGLKEGLHELDEHLAK